MTTFSSSAIHRSVNRISEVIASQCQPRSSDRAIARAQERQQAEAIAAEQKFTAAAFGDLNGWRLSDRDFNQTALARGAHRAGGLAWADTWPLRFADHRYFYRHVDGRCAAIASHPYVDRTPLDEFLNDAEDWATPFGLRVSLPDYPSWWYPGRTVLLLIQPMLGRPHSTTVHQLRRVAR